MRKLSLSILAATIALIPAAAAAEQRGGGAGHSWRGGGAVQGGNVQFRHRGGQMGHPGRHFRHQRMNRGFVIHPFWFGQQFHINNWQVYGFGNPGDGRWVRYYDDAYLIDHDGRVRDHRYGVDWDRYGEQWEDDDGIPSYRGRRDWRPGEGDYEWSERRGGGHHEEGHGHGQVMHGGGHSYGHGGTTVYGGYGGYGYYAYPIVIETITTSGGCGCEEVIEEVVEVRQRAQRRRPPVVRRPPPPRRPPPGERG